MYIVRETGMCVSKRGRRECVSESEEGIFI